MAEYTERDILDMLTRRYTSIRPGTTADRWVRAEHVRAWLGHYGPNGVMRIADMIVADKYPGPGRDQAVLHGFEVKVSRADWLAELRQPEKAEAFRPYLHYWWLVVSDRSIVKPGELPQGWGLLVKAGSVLRQVVPAPRNDPEPMPVELMISLMSASAKTAATAPLRTDAPLLYGYCGVCGHSGACILHQPRLVAARVSESHVYSTKELTGPMPAPEDLAAGLTVAAAPRPVDGHFSYKNEGGQP